MAELYDRELESDEIVFDEDDEYGEDDARHDLELINRDLPDGDSQEQVSSEQLRRYQQYEEVVNRFNQNPVESLRNIAEQLGFEVKPAAQGGNGLMSTTPQTPAPASENGLLADIEGEIDDEYKFLAPVIAKVARKIAQTQINEEVGPIRAQQAEIAKRNRQQEYISAASELAKRAPDWQNREQDMLGRLEFIKTALNGGPMMHHRYGNLLELLYNWASSRDSAARDVAQRYREAPRNRAASSNGNQATRADIVQIIAKEPDRKKHLRLAFDDAVREVFG